MDKSTRIFSQQPNDPTIYNPLSMSVCLSVCLCVCHEIHSERRRKGRMTVSRYDIQDRTGTLLAGDRK